MKNKFLIGLFLIGSALTASAVGFNDGIEYYKAGQYGNARTILENTLNDSGTNKAMSYYYLGQIELLYGNNAKAKDYFDKGMAIDPESPYNYVGLGNYELRMGNPKAAETYFKDAMKKGKKVNEIPVEIARAYYTWKPNDTKNLETVNDYITKARKQSKNQEPSIYVLEGDMLFNQGDHLGDAAAAWEMAISYDSDNPEGYVKYANAYRGVNPAYSIAKYEELLAKRPNSALAQRELAEIYYETNAWDKAADLYGTYINNPNHFPEDEARYCFLLWADKKYDKAIEIAQRLIDQEPDNFQAWRIMLLAQADLKDFDAVEKTAQKFFSLPGKFTQTDYITYGNALLEQKKYDAAADEFLKAVAIDETKASNWMAVANAYFYGDKNKLAADYIEKALSLMDEPTLSDYLRASGYYLYAATDETDPAAKTAYANKGIVAIDKVINGVDPEKMAPDFLRRKGQLLFTRDNDQVTPEVFEAFVALVNKLDEDPANMAPGSPKLKWYQQAYKILHDYYNNIGDEANKKAMLDKFAQVRSLLED